MIRSVLAVSALVAAFAHGCGRPSGPAVDGSGATETGTAAPVAPPTPASVRILGQWEVVANAPSGPVRLGMRFTETTLARFSSGRMTAELPARVVEETEDSVLIELGEGAGEGSGAPLRERFRLIGDDALVHDAVPELVFRRGTIAPHGPEPVPPDDLAAAAGGSGEAAPSDGSGAPGGSGQEAGGAP